MISVCIGIPVYEQPAELQKTLESLWANTPKPFEVLLLPDGPDDATRAELATLSHLPQSLTDEALGSAACFNRLANSTNADVIVLLESGCSVGSDWLKIILSALEANPSHGLAGPSTNHCWNEQSLLRHGVVPPGTLSSAFTLNDINRVSQSVRQRFGNAVQFLEPLHSLADFCYVVRRSALARTGPADEGYGLGPCWEMDYNIRAARAGFRGLWACGAYVHRGSFGHRRLREERRLFDANKQRYQDKFCALHLRQETTAYESHCRGEDCEHFAPIDLIEVHNSQTSRAKLVSAIAPLTVQNEAPLVSCIMSTSNRREYVLQSVRYFQRQDYPHRELLVLDDELGPDLSAELAGDARIRYFRLPGKLSIGSKRNRGCELARGAFVAQWDDDDWYAPSRLSAQLEPLLSGAAQISALSAGVFFDLPKWEFWHVSPDLHRRMFVGDVHGGTLVFHRSLFDRGIRYPDRSIAEDAWFLWYSMQGGAQVRKISGEDLFVYVRHAASSWSFRCGEFLEPAGWQRVERPLFLHGDIEFYRGLCSREDEPRALAQSLVTCIMPTANRRSFVPRAIRCFQAQDYGNRELLILDDGDDCVRDLVPRDERIQYVRLASHPTLGGKRNVACQMSRGEYIMHWDDDDWASPFRISIQIEAMRTRPDIDICGLDRLYFYSPSQREAWLYAHPPGSRKWLSGNTLCYRKSLWQKHRFPEINEGEDTLFVWSLSERQMLPLHDPNFFVATVHSRNTSPKQTCGPGWTLVQWEEIEPILAKEAQL